MLLLRNIRFLVRILEVMEELKGYLKKRIDEELKKRVEEGTIRLGKHKGGMQG